MAQLSELCDILEPSLEATNITQGDKNITISYVLFAALSLCSHLKDWKTKAKYCQPVFKALLTSLIDRFAGLFNRATPPCKRVSELFDDKFGSDTYILATLFDP